MKISRLVATGGLILTCALTPLAFAAHHHDGNATLTSVKLPTVSTYDMKIPVLRLNNPAASARANATLAQMARDALADYTNQPLNLEGVFSYEVKYQDHKLLSILITKYNYTGGAHGFHTQTGIVFDKNTGETRPLSYYLKIKDNKQIIQGLADGKLALYSETMDKIDYNSFFSDIGTALPTSYFLAGDGGIYIVYPPYDLSSYNNGATRVFFSKAMVNQFNREYRE